MYSFYQFLNSMLFSHDGCDYCWDIYVNCYSFKSTHLGFQKLGCFGTAATHLPGCFCPWTFSLNIGLNMLPLDFFISWLYCLLIYSTAESHDLQLIVPVVFRLFHARTGTASSRSLILHRTAHVPWKLY